METIKKHINFGLYSSPFNKHKWIITNKMLSEHKEHEQVLK